MHQLFESRMNAIAGEDEFFQRYLGKAVLDRLEIVGFSTWPSEKRGLLRRLATVIAEAIPGADHVIRNDVDAPGHVRDGIVGDLLMYFGAQLPTTGSQKQFIGVARDHEAELVFRLYIAGTGDVASRAAMIARLDPARTIEGRVLARPADLAPDMVGALLPALEKIGREVGTAQPQGWRGLCPIDCQRNWKFAQNLNQSVAGALFYEVWKDYQTKILPAEVVRATGLLTRDGNLLKNLCVALIAQRVPPKTALARVLGTEEPDPGA